MNNLEYTQQLIEESIFERKHDTIYKHNFTEEDLLKFDDVFNKYLAPEVSKIISLQNEVSSGMRYVIKSDVFDQYIHDLYVINCPKILKGNAISQQFYLLYITSILFYRYNQLVLKLSDTIFINRIYFNNILSMCSKHLNQTRRMIFKLIKSIYNDLKIEASATLNAYYELYRDNENTIKNDIVQLFLTNILPKFNPLDIENLEDFYTILFKRIFIFYLKSKTSIINTEELDLVPTIPSNNVLESQSERFKIYEEALYLYQIQQLCSSSNTLTNINSEFNKLKDVILPNELQKLFLSQIPSTKNNIVSHKLDLFRIYTAKDCDIEIIKNKIPHVYRLLRSVHILSDKKTFSEGDKKYMKDQFYLTLCSIYKNKLNIETSKMILKNISDNLVESLTVGEFIDMVTLTQVDITGPKFIEQFKEFLNIVLNTALGEIDGPQQNSIS